MKKKNFFITMLGGVILIFLTQFVNTSIDKQSSISLENLLVMSQALADKDPCPSHCLDGGIFCYDQGTVYYTMYPCKTTK